MKRKFDSGLAFRFKATQRVFNLGFYETGFGSRQVYLWYRALFDNIRQI